MGVVAQNPKNVGIGIDERTSIVVERGESFYVLGSGAVYVIDGTGVSYSNIAEEGLRKTLSVYDLKVHVLSQGDRFDLAERLPSVLEGELPRNFPKRKTPTTQNQRHEGLSFPLPQSMMPN